MMRTGIRIAAMVLCLAALSLWPAGGRGQESKLAVNVSNLRDVVFTVSWLAESEVTCEIRYGETAELGSVCYDDRGKKMSSRMHYVTVGDGGDGESALKPDTIYYFVVVCGEEVYDNDGAYYSVTTGPTLSPNAPSAAYGKVLFGDGETLAPGAVVRVTVVNKDEVGSKGGSSSLSSLVSEKGLWAVTLTGAREEGLKNYFVISTGDEVQIEATGPAGTSVSKTVSVLNVKPVEDIILPEFSQSK